MTAAVQERGGHVLPQAVQPQVETSQPRPFIHRMKENVTWAWNATYEKLEAAGGQLKLLLKKVWEAIRTFFEPKFESAKKAVVGLYHRFTSKKELAPASTPAAPPPAAAAPPQDQVEQPVVAKVAAEEQKPQGAVPEQQFFVPAPIAPPPPGEQPLQVQMPVQLPVPDPIPAAAANDPAPPVAAANTNAPPPAAPPAAAPAQPPEPETVGIFKIWKWHFWPWN